MSIQLKTRILFPALLADQSYSNADVFRYPKCKHHWLNFAKRFRKFGRGFPVMDTARDAMHRGRKKDTHPTHGCLTLFCGFWSKRGACSKYLISETNWFQPFFEQAPSKRVVGVR